MREAVSVCKVVEPKGLGKKERVWVCGEKVVREAIAAREQDAAEKWDARAEELRIAFILVGLLGSTGG